MRCALLRKEETSGCSGAKQASPWSTATCPAQSPLTESLCPCCSCRLGHLCPAQALASETALSEAGMSKARGTANRTCSASPISNRKKADKASCPRCLLPCQAVGRGDGSQLTTGKETVPLIALLSMLDCLLPGKALPWDRPREPLATCHPPQVHTDAKRKNSA